MPPESELKSDLLAILPGEIREHLLIRSTDSGVSFLQFKDFVVSQTSRILVARRKSPMVGSIDVDFVSAYDAEGHAEQNQGETQEPSIDMSREELQDVLVFAQ